MTTLEVDADLFPPVPVEDPGPPMKLVASVMVGRNEVDRYLDAFLNHLYEFCDLVCIRWEHPDADLLVTDLPLRVLAADPTFYDHEGRARQELIDFTLSFEPTHVLSIDADEFISDGPALRLALAAEMADRGLPKQPTAWPLCMQEIWNIREDGVEIRMDGGWEEHDVAVVWTPGTAFSTPLMTSVGGFTMEDAALACGRIPREIQARGPHTCVAIMHFGWACREERVARHARYVEHDGGRFHDIRHLDSIMFPDDQIDLWLEPWPPRLESWRALIEAHAGVVARPPARIEVQVDEETQAALDADLALLGCCYLVVDADGRARRLEPADVDPGALS